MPADVLRSDASPGGVMMSIPAEARMALAGRVIVEFAGRFSNRFSNRMIFRFMDELLVVV